MVPSWICPNPKCTYDKQLESGQHCPLCGEEAKSFDSTEFGNILKEKWDLKRAIKKAKEEKEVLARMKYCPKCGSSNINFLIFFLPSVWKCLDCGYQDVFIVEDGKLAEEIRKRYQKQQKKKG